MFYIDLYFSVRSGSFVYDVDLDIEDWSPTSVSSHVHLFCIIFIML